MSDTEFEIQILVNDRWSVLATAPTEDQAIQRAEDEWNRAGCQGIRVVAHGATVVGKGKEREILSRRRNEDQPDRISLGHTSGLNQVYCKTVPDLVGRPARQYVGALMRPFTDHHQYTSEEFLFLPALAGNFLETNELAPMAINRVASEQAHAFSLDEPERRAALWRLCEDGVVHLKKVADKILPIPDSDFGSVVQAAKADATHGDWIVMQSLAADLSTAKGLVGKLDRLLTLLENTQDAEARAEVDFALAGLLGGQVGRELLGDQPNLASWISGIILLLKGQEPSVPKRGDEHAETRQRIIRLIRARRAPMTIAALRQRAWHLFSSNLELSKNKPSEERRAVQAVISRLIGDHDFEHPEQTVDALTRRCMRLSNSGGRIGRVEAIQLAFDILPDRAMGIMYLVHLAAHPDYQDCRKEILAIWIKLLAIDRVIQLLAPDLSDSARINRMNRLAAVLETPHLPKDALARMRDTVGKVFDLFVREAEVVDKIDNAGLPSEQRAMALVQFASSSSLLSPSVEADIRSRLQGHEDMAGFRALFSAKDWETYSRLKEGLH